MVELVKYVVDSLVDNKEKVSVIEEGDVIKVTVAAGDMGKVIGKQGKIAKAIRTIVKSAAAKEDKKYTVEINEEAE